MSYLNIIFLAKALEDSSCASSFLGPNTFTPAASSASARPALSGASGPITAHVMFSFFASSTIRSISESLISLCTSRSEEHTSELQSRGHLVCRLLLEKKKLNKMRQDARRYRA